MESSEKFLSLKQCVFSKANKSTMQLQSICFSCRDKKSLEMSIFPMTNDLLKTGHSYLQINLERIGKKVTHSLKKEIIRQNNEKAFSFMKIALAFYKTT